MIIAGCALVCLCVCLPMFLTYKPVNRPFGAVFKTLGSLCATIPAFIAAVKLDEHAWICVIALLLCCVADFLLEVVFPAGMGCFGCAHIVFTAWYITAAGFTLPHLICIICLMLIGAYVIYKWRAKIGRYIPAFALYCILLCVMAGSGIAGGLALYNITGWLTAAGAALFALSDAMVCRKLFFTESNRFNAVTMIIYYSALLCISSACLYL
ncbi:MAG: lysoplasmalogenase [Clostridia bacterium]|nr:lysoplasmalogenase [Clostridia bacterium]